MKMLHNSMSKCYEAPRTDSFINFLQKYDKNECPGSNVLDFQKLPMWGRDKNLLFSWKSLLGSHMLSKQETQPKAVLDQEITS